MFVCEFVLGFLGLFFFSWLFSSFSHSRPSLRPNRVMASPLGKWALRTRRRPHNTWFLRLVCRPSSPKTGHPPLIWSTTNRVPLMHAALLSWSSLRVLTSTRAALCPPPSMALTTGACLFHCAPCWHLFRTSCLLRFCHSGSHPCLLTGSRLLATRQARADGDKFIDRSSPLVFYLDYGVLSPRALAWQ